MTKNILKLAIASALAVSGAANAATIADSFVVAHQTTELSSATFVTGNSATGSLDQFDVSLGTLTGITLTLNGESISSTTLSNTGASSQDFTYISTLAWTFEVQDTGADDIADFYGAAVSTAGNFTTVLASAGNAFVDVTIAGGNTLDLGTSTDTISELYTVNVADFALYIGSGTFNIGCNTQTSTTFTGGGGNISQAQVSTAGCSVDVEYTYNVTPVVPVSEPSIIALLGLGLFGIGMASRRKTK